MTLAPLSGLAVLAVALVLAPRPSGRRFTQTAPRRTRAARWRSPASIQRQCQRHFPDAIDLFVIAVRAGYLPAQATQTLTPMLPGPLAVAFADVNARVAGGARFADAVAALQTHVGAPAWPFVDALAMADRYGLPLGPVLDRLSAEAHATRRRNGEARARELPVRLAAPLVVCTLPSFIALAVVPLLLGALSSLQQ